MRDEMNTDHIATPRSDRRTGAPDEITATLVDRRTMRRGLLAALGGVAAAAAFRVTGANATAAATLESGSTVQYGILASPGILQTVTPNFGSTNHGVVGCNALLAVPMSSGVAGLRSGAELAGVLGINDSGAGVSGHAESGTGAQGLSQSGTGLRGKSITGVGAICTTRAPNKAALLAQNTAASNPLAGLFRGNVRVQGNFQVTGAKAAAVALPDGTLVTMYCQESPEPFFEDFGRAKLVGGVARVSLEGEFAGLVHLDDYMVFLTAEGDSNGLFISKREPQAFEVKEMKGGTGSFDFTYRLVAKRKDIPGERLARLEPLDEMNVADLEGPESPSPRRRFAGPDEVSANG